ncbi:hypothetical protein GCM10020256_01740 [Streptomyces thermocoprophilus]
MAAFHEKVWMPVRRLRVKNDGDWAVQVVEFLAQIASKGTSGQLSAVSLVSDEQSAAVHRSAYSKVTLASALSVKSAPARRP